LGSKSHQITGGRYEVSTQR